MHLGVSPSNQTAPAIHRMVFNRWLFQGKPDVLARGSTANEIKQLALTLNRLDLQQSKDGGTSSALLKLVSASFMSWNGFYTGRLSAEGSSAGLGEQQMGFA